MNATPSAAQRAAQVIRRLTDVPLLPRHDAQLSAIISREFGLADLQSLASALRGTIRPFTGWTCAVGQDELEALLAAVAKLGGKQP